MIKKYLSFVFICVLSEDMTPQTAKKAGGQKQNE